MSRLLEEGLVLPAMDATFFNQCVSTVANFGRCRSLPHWLKKVTSMAGSARPSSKSLDTWKEVGKDDSAAMILNFETQSCNNWYVELSLLSLISPVLIAEKVRDFCLYYLSANAGLAPRFFITVQLKGGSGSKQSVR